MRTNIDIDDELMKQAMKTSDGTTKKAVVEEALKLYVRSSKQERALNSLWGIAKDDLGWDPPPEKWAAAKLRDEQRTKSLGKKAA